MNQQWRKIESSLKQVHHFNAKFIIFDSKFIILNTKFIIFRTSDGCRYLLRSILVYNLYYRIMLQNCTLILTGAGAALVTSAG